MGLFSKGKSRDQVIAEGIAQQEADAASAGQKKDDEFSSGNPKIDIEFTKIKAQLEASAEVRKSNSERFSRVSEQLGELRGMIVDANKAMSKIEVAATKATDLVESVHPEKLMIEVRRQDGKIEAVRAAIESNEAIMKDMMSEMKRVRDQMGFYKGTEQVIQLNDEVKQELANIKKMEAIVEKHADRVETIFIEVEKKFSSFEKYDTTVKDVQEGFRKVSGEFEKVKAKLATKEDKKEFVDLLDKFNDFEKHTTNLLKLLDDRSKLTKTELDTEFKKLRRQLIDDMKKGKIDKTAEKEVEHDLKVQEQQEALDKEAEEAGKKDNAAEELDALAKNAEREVGRGKEGPDPEVPEQPPVVPPQDAPKEEAPEEKPAEVPEEKSEEKPEEKSEQKSEENGPQEENQEGKESSDQSKPAQSEDPGPQPDVVEIPAGDTPDEYRKAVETMAEGEPAKVSEPKTNLAEVDPEQEMHAQEPKPEEPALQTEFPAPAPPDSPAEPAQPSADKPLEPVGALDGEPTEEEAPEPPAPPGEDGEDHKSRWQRRFGG